MNTILNEPTDELQIASFGSARRKGRAGSKPVRRIKVLDGLRGLAALEVMLGHAIWLLWLPDSSRPFWLLMRKLTAVFARYGGQAVVVFFLLSGFVIHYRQALAKSAGKAPSMDIGRYARRRAFRLYPELSVALIFTLVLDLVGARINPDFYAGVLTMDFAVAFQHVSHSVVMLVGNLTFMQGLVPGILMYGTNTPLWSLAYEFVYYALYPAVYLPLWRRFGSGRVALMMIALGALLAPFMGYATILRVLAYYGTWTFGAWLAEGYVRGFRLPGPAWVYLGGAAAAFIGLILSYSLAWNSYVYDWLWCLLCALLVILALADGIEQNMVLDWYRRLLVSFAVLAPSSYSLYVLHFPLFALISAAWLDSFDQLPASGWVALAAATLALLTAVLVTKMLEEPLSMLANRRQVSGKVA